MVVGGSILLIEGGDPLETACSIVSARQRGSRDRREEVTQGHGHVAIPLMEPCEVRCWELVGDDVWRTIKTWQSRHGTAIRSSRTGVSVDFVWAGL